MIDGGVRGLTGKHQHSSDKLQLAMLSSSSNQSCWNLAHVFSALPLLSAFNQGGVGGVPGHKTVNYTHNVRFMSIQAETAWMATDNQTRHSLKPVWLKACGIFFLTNILNLQKLNKFAVLKQMYIQPSPSLEVSTLFRVKWNMEYWIIGIIGEGWAGEKYRFSRSSIAGFMCRC